MESSKKAQDETNHNTAAIRELLKAAFDKEEFELLCYDYFRPVYGNFAPGMTHLQKIQLLIIHCEKTAQFEELLTQIKKLNPAQYENHISSIRQPPPVREIDYGSSRTRLELTFPFDSSEFSPEKRNMVVGAALGAVAGVLNMLLDVRDPGSTNWKRDLAC